MELYNLDLPELKDKPLRAIVPVALRNKESLFEAIRKQDVLLHHPYSAFGTIVDFIQAAADDPKGSVNLRRLRATASPGPQSRLRQRCRGRGGVAHGPQPRSVACPAARRQAPRRAAVLPGRSHSEAFADC